MTELRAQPPDPNIDLRVVADAGPTNNYVVEPEIAVGHDAVVVLAFRPGVTTAWARYSILNRSTGVWDSHFFDYPSAWNGDTNTSVDVSVAYDPNSRSFVATALGSNKHGTTADSHILMSRLDPNSNNPNGIGRFQRFSSIAAFPGGLIGFDKPYVVGGEWTQFGREYYCIYVFQGNSYRYSRSIDGGLTWAGGPILVDPNDPNDPNDSTAPFPGGFCAAPAVYGSGDLFIAYRYSDTEIRFIRGVDPPNPAQVGGVRFYQIQQECEIGPSGPFDPLLGVHTNISIDDINPALPGQYDSATPGRIPQLVADPTNAERMYLVYHDEDPNYAGDMNVYCHQLTGSGNYWCVGPKVRVNADLTSVDDDQFMPSVTVDDHGYVHVIYYDERRYTDQDDGDSPAKFDCYYAYSKNGGASWTEVRLDGDDPDDEALNTGTVGDIKHYIGIDWFEDDVFTAFTGTVPYDPNDPTNLGVIWSSRIRW